MFAYPFLFVAIYIESFILVTLLSKPAREARTPKLKAATPTVAVIVPCWNEASTLAATCESLLALEYPKDKLEIILIDDGSTDTTSSIMAQFAEHPQVSIIRKENGGKHTALNAGIAATSAEFIGCLDADSFVEPDALREIISCFVDTKVAAATAAMSVYRPKNILQRMQNAEYTFGITLRHSLSSVNGLYVTPGPFSFYRRSIVDKLGGFRYGHQTEDMEMALRIQKAGYKIANSPRARVYTKAPDTLPKLVKQRTRWTSGFLRNIFGEYRDLIGNRNYGALGMIVLPSALISIGSSILLFSILIFKLMSNALSALQIRADIPLAYAMTPHGSFDWFYLPAHVFLLLAATTLLASITLITIGKRISRTPGNLTLDIASYVLLYAFVVPLWLIRATSDVTFGIRRGWRY